MSDFAIGFSSSVLSSTIIYPFDIIKTNFQVARYRNQNLSFLNICRIIYRINGLGGFYKGLNVSLMSQPIFYGSYFQTKKYKHLIPSTGYEFSDKFIAPFVCGMISSTIANPFFVMRTRIQSEILNKNDSIKVINMGKDILKNEGFKGFFKGIGTTCLNNSKLVIQFPLYDHVKEQNSINDSKLNGLYASFISKGIANTVFYPFDLIRTNQRNSTTKLTIKESAKHIYKESGIIGFYRGSLLYNSVSIPTFMLFMFFFETFKQIVN